MTKHILSCTTVLVEVELWCLEEPAPLLRQDTMVYDDGMKKLVIANWKSHKDSRTIAEWVPAFTAKLGKTLVPSKVEVSIAPSSPFIPLVSEMLSHGVSVAAQDVSQFPQGKNTGATAATQLASLGVAYAIVGHSERRRYFHETHQEVANKAEQCIEAGITPIVCVDDEYVAAQASALPTELAQKCVVAYEALSAIGTGNNVDASQVSETTAQIKELFGKVPVLYGGSVTAGNVAEYADISDGWLVGTASLSIDDFLSLLTTIANF